MRRRLTSLFLSICAFSLIVAPKVSAFSISKSLSNTILDYMDKNGTYYYNPNGYANNCYPGIGSYDGSATAGLSALQSAFVDQYHDIAVSLSTEHQIPWEAVTAQGLLESASGTSALAIDKNNFFGLNAVDSDAYNQAYSYNSAAEGWKGYFTFIEENSRYRKAGAFDHAGDPYGYITALKNAGYATDPNYIAKVSTLINAIENRSAEKGWKSSSDLAKTINPSYTAPHLCFPATYGNGDINATALMLSWADRSHSLNDPKTEYSAALSRVGLSSYPDQFAKIGASCDAFVATVLRYSGADPDVPCCGAATMLHYFASSNKYQEIPNIGNSSNLQPGDIRVKNDHIELFVQDGGKGKIASASWGDRTADHAIGYYADSSYRIFRLSGGNNV